MTRNERLLLVAVVLVLLFAGLVVIVAPLAMTLIAHRAHEKQMDEMQATVLAEAEAAKKRLEADIAKMTAESDARTRALLEDVRARRAESEAELKAHLEATQGPEAAAKYIEESRAKWDQIVAQFEPEVRPTTAAQSRAATTPAATKSTTTAATSPRGESSDTAPPSQP